LPSAVYPSPPAVHPPSMVLSSAVAAPSIQRASVAGTAANKIHRGSALACRNTCKSPTVAVPRPAVVDGDVAGVGPQTNLRIRNTMNLRGTWAIGRLLPNQGAPASLLLCNPHANTMNLGTRGEWVPVTDSRCARVPPSFYLNYKRFRGPPIGSNRRCKHNRVS
jgi:hypothetical protein